MILADIGDTDGFAPARKLVALACGIRGLESGQFQATVNRIAKRRHAGSAMSETIPAFDHATRAAGKPHKLTAVAGINKLLRWIYAALHFQ